jgi:hypothetical protein
MLLRILRVPSSLRWLRGFIPVEGIAGCSGFEKPRFDHFEVVLEKLGKR